MYYFKIYIQPETSEIFVCDIKTTYLKIYQNRNNWKSSFIMNGWAKEEKHHLKRVEQFETFL